MTTKNNLTLVIGAGASEEFDLPAGEALKSGISSLLTILVDDDMGRKTSGDNLMWEALALVASECHTNSHHFLPVLRQICNAMPLAPSIDNFIDTHQSNNDIEICGKLAISRAILRAERQSKLYLDPHNQKSTVPFRRVEKTWLNLLLRIATENCQAASLKDRLSGINFIVFNYDRCVEHYLYHWLKTYYLLSGELAAEIVNNIKIYHPYGRVGSLPWQVGPNSPFQFGYEPSASELLQTARQIKTFTEGTDPDSSEISEIRSLIQTSERLLFLGFAYHRLNLRLLGLPCALAQNRKFIFGSGFGISEYNCEMIKSDLTTDLLEHRQAIIRNDLKCGALIKEYSRGLYLH